MNSCQLTLTSIFQLTQHQCHISIMFSPSGLLYRIDQVPDHFRELFIMTGYRSPGSTHIQCLLSLFTPTNETFNFWTHFLPACYFLWRLVSQAFIMDFFADPFHWPLAAFMVSIVIYPLASAVAHTFNALSDRARHICFFLDYAALSLYSLGSAVGYRAYSFAPGLLNSSVAKWYIVTATINAVGCTMLACETRFLKHGHSRKALRFIAFAFPCLFVCIPVLYRITFCDAVSACEDRALVPFMRQTIMALLAGFFYNAHLPERFLPGIFDVVGHSHQLFHICSAFGTYQQLKGLLLDIEDRKPLLQELVDPNDYPLMLQIFVIVLLVNAIIIFVMNFLKLNSMGKDVTIAWQATHSGDVHSEENKNKNGDINSSPLKTEPGMKDAISEKVCDPGVNGVYSKGDGHPCLQKRHTETANGVVEQTEDPNTNGAYSQPPEHPKVQ